MDFFECLPDELKIEIRAKYDEEVSQDLITLKKNLNKDMTYSSVKCAMSNLNSVYGNKRVTKDNLRLMGLDDEFLHLFDELDSEIDRFLIFNDSGLRKLYLLMDGFENIFVRYTTNGMDIDVRCKTDEDGNNSLHNCKVMNNGKEITEVKIFKASHKFDRLTSLRYLAIPKINKLNHIYRIIYEIIPTALGINDNFEINYIYKDDTERVMLKEGNMWNEFDRELDDLEETFEFKYTDANMDEDERIFITKL